MSPTIGDCSTCFVALDLLQPLLPCLRCQWRHPHLPVTVTSPLNEGPVQQFVLLSVLSSETMNEMQEEEEEEDKKEEEEEVEKQ